LEQVNYLRNHVDKLKFLIKVKQEETERLQTELSTLPLAAKVDEDAVIVSSYY